MGSCWFTVTTNEHKAELRFIKQENNIRYYTVDKLPYGRGYEIFDYQDEHIASWVTLGFKETTTPGLWKFTEIGLAHNDSLWKLYKKRDSGDCANVVIEYLNSHDRKMAKLKEKLSSILKVGEETLTLS